jgi:hypothetical protein
MAEMPASTDRFDSDVADPATLARIQVAEDIDTATYTTCPTVDRLVAECVGKPLHRMSRRDRISVEVQLAMDLDKSHRSTVAREHGETARTQMATPQRTCIRRLRRNRRRPAPVRDAVTVHDVFRFDARPHDDTKLRQLRSDSSEFYRQGALGFVE